MGDHPFMTQPSQAKVFPKPRYIYFKILDKKDTRIPKRDLMTHFDVAPTILDLLNINEDGSLRFGLGISLFSGISQDDYKKHLRKVTSEKILNHSLTYDLFWLPKLY